MSEARPALPYPRIALVVGAVAAALAAATLYGRAPEASKGAADCPAASLAAAERLAPLAKGDVAGVAVAKAPRQAFALAFLNAEGKPVTLADFKGRALLLNLWATWCVPCRAEMPALDRLQAKEGDANFEVVAVNVDTTRLDRPKAFLDEIGVKSLARYSDPKGDAFETLRVAGKALGLPTSLLIDKDGCEVGVIAGPANWDSDDAQKLVAALKGA